MVQWVFWSHMVEGEELGEETEGGPGYHHVRRIQHLVGRKTPPPHTPHGYVAPGLGVLRAAGVVDGHVQSQRSLERWGGRGLLYTLSYHLLSGG